MISLMKTMIPRVRSRREGRDEIYPDFYVFFSGFIWIDMICGVFSPHQVDIFH